MKKTTTITPIPVFRKTRKRTGFDIFRASDHAELPPRVSNRLDDGGKIFDVGDWNAKAKEAWEGLRKRERKEFELLAKEENEASTSADASEPALVRKQWVLA